MTPAPLPTPEQWAELVSRHCVRAGSGCLVWTGTTSNGYGKHTFQRRVMWAHRTALAVALRRPLKPGSVACHHCDNPPCCEPSHLYEGSARSNTADMVGRGRRRDAQGEAASGAKLAEEQVREIRRLREQGRTCQSIADQFGVDMQSVWRISTRRTWKHVT